MQATLQRGVWVWVVSSRGFDGEALIWRQPPTAILEAASAILHRAQILQHNHNYKVQRRDGHDHAMPPALSSTPIQHPFLAGTYTYMHAYYTYIVQYAHIYIHCIHRHYIHTCMHAFYTYLEASSICTYLHSLHT